ncbi:MAG: HmuY family protein [Longimicrobiales bacterium]
MPSASYAIVAALFLAAGALVTLSLQRSEPRTFPLTSPAPQPVRAALVGPLTYTVDARHPDHWTRFDFGRGSVVADDDWDLAFRRNRIITNGGPGFTGAAGIIDLGDVAFDSVRTVPTAGYEPTTVRSDSSNRAIERWYDYGFTSHLLTPKPQVYAVRTADGRYAKLQILAYYCPGAEPACLTFRYAYQGDGSTRVAPVQ